MQQSSVREFRIGVRAIVTATSDGGLTLAPEILHDLWELGLSRNHPSDGEKLRIAEWFFDVVKRVQRDSQSVLKVELMPQLVPRGDDVDPRSLSMKMRQPASEFSVAPAAAKA